MSLRDRLRELLARPLEGLASAESTAALVPPTALYVTVCQFLVVPDVRAFVGGAPGTQPVRRQVGPAPSGARPSTSGLLVLTADRLSVIRAEGEVWSAAVGGLTDLDAHRHGGFVLSSADGSGLACTTPTPVVVPDGARWTTCGRVTNLVGGWDKVLEPLGVRVHW